MDYIRLCPKCNTERPVSELYCQNEVDETPCGWLLMNVVQTPVGGTIDIQETESITQNRFCENGHEVSPDDFMCMECGADILSTEETQTSAEKPSKPERIVDYEVVETITTQSATKECFLVTDNKQDTYFLTLYHKSSEPDQAIYSVLENADTDHIPKLIKTGEWEGRFFEVSEQISGGSIEALSYMDTPDLLKLVNEIGRALHDFSEAGVRHRDLCPQNILIRDLEKFDLVIIDFSSARLSDYDLDTDSALELTQYTAPEAIIGGVSPASDWWSLGMIVLEQLTKGSFFEGINVKAFMIHLVTKGVQLPDDLDDRMKLLLQGLLCRDPLQRWHWEQVDKWLKGEHVEPPLATQVDQKQQREKKIRLGTSVFTNMSRFALAAAEDNHWEEGLALFKSGELAIWLEEILGDHQIVSSVRHLRNTTEIDVEWRFSMALMHLNQSLPLTWRGQIIMPAWLIGNPNMATTLLTSEIPDLLDRMNREKWLVNLKSRRSNVLHMAKTLDIELDTEKFNINALCTSRVKLKAEMNLLRQLFPDAEQSGLSDLIGRTRQTEEDTLIVLSANTTQFTTLEQAVQQTVKLAKKHNLNIDEEFYTKMLTLPRAELYTLLSDQLEGFSQCANEALNRWADRYRIEKRLPLIPSVLCLSLPKTEWVAPPKHQYATNLLRFFERRIVHASMRGPLVRLIISTHSLRIDMMQLGTDLKPTKRLLDGIVNRSSAAETADPLCFSTNNLLEYRTRGMLRNTENFKRDTGLNSLYVGFPFIISQVSLAHVPRVIPLMLWPVELRFGGRNSQKLSLGFDKAREEIRLNPALERALDEEIYKKIKQVYKDILKRSTLNAGEVLDAFGSISNPTGSSLMPHVDVSFKLEEIGLALHNSAVIFNANFTGQAISEDLRTLQKLPHKGTAMEPLLRITETKLEERKFSITEEERFTVVPIDPSQEEAAMQSRLTPGVVIEGPPGTGKSQTIVNIISDAIGNREKVLVVCQKRAAIQVILKRLEAIGLGDRTLAITDINRDRQDIIRSIRSQLGESIGKKENEPLLTQLKQNRNQIARRIDRLEGELNVASVQAHRPDPISGKSYRSILSELIQLQTSQYIDVPEARSLLENFTTDELNIAEEQVKLLLHHWLPSQYEESPLHALNLIQPDISAQNAVEQDLNHFLNAEEERKKCITDNSGVYDKGDIKSYRSWLNEHQDKLKRLTEAEVRQGQEWFNLIYDEINTRSVGQDIVNKLGNLVERMQGLDQHEHIPEQAEALFRLTNESLDALILAAQKYLKKPRYKIFYPFYWLGTVISNKRLTAQIEALSPPAVKALLSSANFEKRFRKLRHAANNELNTLGRKAITIYNIKLFRVEVANHREALLNACALADILKQCPLPVEAKTVLKTGKIERYQQFVQDMTGACVRFEHRQRSSNALKPLKQWITEKTFEHYTTDIDHNNTDISGLTKLSEAMATFVPYQNFRLKLKDVTIRHYTLQLLSLLRKHEASIEAFSSDQWSTLMRNTIRREGMLGWKQRIERNNPKIRLAEGETEILVKDLSQSLEEIKEVNRHLLSLEMDNEHMATRTEWSRITGLRGKNYRKLREFIDQGSDLGLQELRPIWLMSPEVVSQAIPLQAQLFDLLIFDEASQIMIDHAIPALYRAKRVVICGDEKQMPPTGFFSSKIESDEEEHIPELEEDRSEEELTQYQNAWNRKEIKDCPDLLTLAKTVLPTTTLQIHYRSRYKALINFSNNAFYNGQLHVPAYHPLTEIKEVKPLEVIRVDGIYDQQTNVMEAETIVDYLASSWESSEGERLSIGIVTFNKKQAELIEDKIQERALADEAFMEILNIERERRQEGEDMGLFVKNVENVQGDERDMILFSTTFGPNPHGLFRRNFGALGHFGGERRLNVAITRARMKIVIATSMPVKSISDMLSTGRAPAKPRDYIQGYLNFSEIHSRGQIEVANQQVRALSRFSGLEPIKQENDGFKKTVKQYITSLGYTAIENNDHNVFYLDLAIENRDKKSFAIGIECDTPKNKLLKAARYRELWRPQVLGKTIPVLHRINSFKWFESTEEEQQRLKEAIENALT